MKTQLVCSFILSTAVLGAAIAAPFEGNNKDAMAITLRLPDMTPRVSLRGNVASVTIPKDLMEAALGQTLRINEQSIKDTEFNRVTLKQTNVKIVGDQLEVSGVLQGQHRERIAKVFGKWKHTPWASASGRVTQRFGVQVRNNQTVVKNIGDPKIEGLDGRWYAGLVSDLGSIVGPGLSPKITKELSRFNGLDIKAFTIEAASRPLALQLRLNESSVRTALQRNIGSINAGFNGQSNFIISFTIPVLK
jgi:hypothetical protein